MDDTAIGRLFRHLRLRLGWRQGLCCTTQGGVARETVTGYAADLYAIDQTTSPELAP
jgi:hypothetical protein